MSDVCLPYDKINCTHSMCTHCFLIKNSQISLYFLHFVYINLRRPDTLNYSGTLRNLIRITNDSIIDSNVNVSHFKY